MSLTLHQGTHQVAEWALEKSNMPGRGGVVLGQGLTLEGGTASGHVSGVALRPDDDSVVLSSEGNETLAIALDAAGVTVQTDQSLDLGDLVAITFERTNFTVLKTVSHEDILTRVLECSAREIATASHRAHELTRNHVKTREQFGKPLIKLPQVASNLARMRVLLTQIDAGLAILDSRNAMSEREQGNVSLVARAVRSTVASAGTGLIRLAHQLHGAKGVRQDYPLHEYSRIVWQSRDYLIPETINSEALGTGVLEAGEAALWDSLTPLDTN